MRRSTSPRIKNGYVKGSNDITVLRQINVRRYGSRSSRYSLGRTAHYLKGKRFNGNYGYHSVVSSIRFGFVMYHANLRRGRAISTTIHILRPTIITT